MPENPWEMIARSQRAAVGLFAETMSTVVDMGRAGVTRPEEVLAQVSAMASAMGDLAGSTAKPLEYFIASQRQLAETMAAFAVLQRQMAEVVESAAANHAAIVQALELMSNPVIGVAQRLRSEEPPPKRTSKQSKPRTPRAPRTPRTPPQQAEAEPE
jgi:hypothetical protein